MVSTLYRLSELRDSGFGQPDPRHGLRLLWWFAKKCVQIDNGHLHALCDPTEEEFGFRQFYNVEQLLPHTNHPYYKTGNLNNPDSLPYYVTENFTGYSDDSNIDRIIVSLSEWNDHIWFHKIYVTQHSDQTHFDKSHTFHISPDLMKDIQNLTLPKFLKQMENDQNQFYFKQQCKKLQYYPSSASNQSLQDICATCCTVLGVIFALFLFFGFLYISRI